MPILKSTLARSTGNVFGVAKCNRCLMASVLISGAGVAGPVLAYFLKRHGFRPLIVERSRSLRLNGYAIDFWGVGIQVAQRMDIMEQLRHRQIKIDSFRFVNAEGVNSAEIPIKRLIDEHQDKWISILRSDVSLTVFEAAREVVGEDLCRFDDSIVGLKQSEESVTVEFASGIRENFDFVIGADGLHSNVRKLIFEDENTQFENHLGYYCSSYTLQTPAAEPAFIAFNAPGKQAATYSLGNNATAFLITRSPERQFADTEQQKEYLRQEFAEAGWESRKLVDQLDNTNDFYFDSVSQVHMESWSKGRIALVGDACGCPSLISGQGTALAMAGAYVLAGELYNASLRPEFDYKSAFDKYQSIMQPFVESKQDQAKKFADTFLPKTQASIDRRNLMIRLGSRLIPYPILAYFVDRYLRHDLKLSDYGL